MYTPDGRSIVDTIGQRRFRVLERGMLDGYHTAKVELLRDHPLEDHEFQGLREPLELPSAIPCPRLDLFQLNRDTYNRVRQWFDGLHPRLRAAMSQQLDGYPPCDDLTRESGTDVREIGPARTDDCVSLQLTGPVGRGSC